MIWGGADIIIMKYTIYVMGLNHSKTILFTLVHGENNVFKEVSLVPKNLGTTALIKQFIIISTNPLLMMFTHSQSKVGTG